MICRQPSTRLLACTILIFDVISAHAGGTPAPPSASRVKKYQEVMALIEDLNSQIQSMPQVDVCYSIKYRWNMLRQSLVAADKDNPTVEAIYSAGNILQGGKDLRAEAKNHLCLQ